MITKQEIINEITSFVTAEDKNTGVLRNRWRTPLVGFADAQNPEFLKLREIAHPQHVMPWEVIPDAKTVLAYFVPFSEWIGRSNRGEGLASAEWARAYEETNAMFIRLNRHLINMLESNGFTAAVPVEALVFDRVNITCRWSQRHVARLAGLGTFGLNNMLITKSGCCGRYNSVITNMAIEHDGPLKEEYCLYKRNNSCGACVLKCPTGALTKTGFDRVKCFEQCMLNAGVHRGYGNSYTSKAGEEPEESGSDVCGKCLIGVPCTFRCP
jgi:epoxyqueuosine reductase QueG